MIVAKRLARLTLLLCCAVLVAAAYAAWRWLCLDAAPKQPPIQYTITVDVDYEKTFLNVTQVVQVPNRGVTPLTSIVFNVPPAAPAFNAFMLTSVAVGSSLVAWTQDGVMLDIPLSQPLPPGDTATVTLRWGGKLPASDGRYGASDGVLVLGNWYPMLAVLQDGAWLRHQYTSIGDAFFTEVADYDVTVINLPDKATVAASGRQVSHTGGTWVFRSENARDFALAISNRFQVQTRKVDNVNISVYYTSDRSEAAKTSLDIAEQAMRWYSKKIGPYPYPSLAMVQIPDGGIHVAQEHAGLFTLRSDIFFPGSVGIYVAHELAHAWFFGAVGNDQIREPWMDEGLATGVSLDFYKEAYPREYTGLLGTWGGSPELFKDTLELNRGIMDFSNGSVYFFTIYRQGSTFFSAVREAMGDDAYWKALRQYVEEFTFSIARPQDLLRALRSASTADLVPIYRQYLDYPYLKYPNMAVEIAGTDGQTFEGQVLVPITVTADSPTYTVAIMLDSQVITTSADIAPIPVDAAALSDGQHELRVIADDGGLNQRAVRRTFRVLQPTPTPQPTATRAAGASPTGAVTSTRQATPSSPLSPISPPPAQPTPGTQPPQPKPTGNIPLLIAALLVVAFVLAAWAGLARRRRRRW